MNKINFLTPDKNNLYTFLYIGIFLFFFSVLDVTLNSFFNINLTSFLPDTLSFFLPLILGFIGTLIILRPGIVEINIGVYMVLLSGLLWSTVIIIES